MSERERFAEWAKGEGLSLARFENTRSERHGEYFMAETRGAWWGWKARALLAKHEAEET